MSTGSKTRRQRLEDREDALLSAATRIFNTKGFVQTTIAEIARESGVADGTVYLYFKNKRDLGQAALAQFYGHLTETAQAGVDKRQSVRSKLNFLARNHMQMCLANWGLLEAVPNIASHTKHYDGSDLYHMNKNYTAIFDRIVNDALAEGSMASETPIWILRDLFFGPMEYGSRSLMLKQRPEDASEFARHVVDRFLAPYAGVLPAESPDQGEQKMEQLITRFEAALTRLERS